MRVFIAEKPSLAKAIFEGLGGSVSEGRRNGYYQKGNDVVTWCVGHLLEIAEPEQEWALDQLPIPSQYPPKMVPIERTKEQLNVVGMLLDKATQIVNAGDPDEEGNLLIDEVILYCNASHKPTQRLLVADLNLGPVQEALANMRPAEEFQFWTQSALARAIGDQLFGFNLTRVYTLAARLVGFTGVLSIGRVQTVCLGMVNERTLANQNHEASFYYNLVASMSFKGDFLKARYVPTESNDIDEHNRLVSESEANSLVYFATGKTGVVTDVETSTAKAQPPKPFSLSSIQQLCAKKYGFSAERTLEIIQKLYETHKVVTYPRTDNRYLGDSHYEMRGDMLDVVAKAFPDLASKADLSLKHSCFNAKKIEAHHAIVPTLKSIEGITLSQDEMKVYEQISISFVALFMPPSVREKTVVTIDLDGHIYQASQTVVKSYGWEALYKGDIQEEAPIIGLDISTLKIGDMSEASTSSIEKKKTNPPKYHVESSLLASMTKAGKLIKDPELRKQFEAKDKGDRDNCGSIGTEATRANILSTIKNRVDLVELVKMKGYKEPVWRTTKQGQEFCAMLPPEFLAPDISAMWSQQQDLIRSGELTVPEFLADLDNFIAGHVNRVKIEGVKITVVTHKCPTCSSGFLTRRVGEKGPWWGCNSYPDCKTSFPDKNGKPSTTPKKKKRKGLRLKV